MPVMSKPLPFEKHADTVIIRLSAVLEKAHPEIRSMTRAKHLVGPLRADHLLNDIADYTGCGTDSAVAFFDFDHTALFGR